MLASGALGPVPERQRKFLEISRQEALRLSGLLERLLTTSRLEARAPELAPVPCDAGDLARRAVDAAAARARTRGTTLSADLPDGPLPVLADAGRMAQVLDNLLDNALRHGPEGGTVVVRVAAEDGMAVFHVLDHGPGVPPAEAEMVFSKYYRARNPEAGSRADGSDPGSGLGLPIAKAIVEAHGGTMRLDDAPGWGGAFRFTLPLASAMR
jgi:signal transduction histidine kinase